MTPWRRLLKSHFQYGSYSSDRNFNFLVDVIHSCFSLDGTILNSRQSSMLFVSILVNCARMKWFKRLWLLDSKKDGVLHTTKSIFPIYYGVNSRQKRPMEFRLVDGKWLRHEISLCLIHLLMIKCHLSWIIPIENEYLVDEWKMFL